MPSTRLYDGDLKVLMNCWSKADDRLSFIESKLASVLRETPAPSQSGLPDVIRQQAYSQSTPQRPAANLELKPLAHVK